MAAQKSGTLDAFRPDNPQLQLEMPSPAGPRAPRLLVVVDTEEEFDWSAPFSRDARSVRSLRDVQVVQRLFDACGLKPTYVVDFPVASQDDGVAPLRELLADGRCSIGAHLHPWVNPPYDEPLGNANSFACNLGEALEEAKLTVLHDQIGSAFGAAPLAYKAGRYGIGVKTLGILSRLGFEVDTSVNPHMDFSSSDGPDFRGFPDEPFLMRGGLAEVPCTTGFHGMAWRHGSWLHGLASSPAFERLRLPGVLSRMGVLNRINLSPETSTLAEMRDLTRALLGRGVRTFTVSFHSPSVQPGHTPYVRSAADLRRFTDRMRAYFDFFFGEVGGHPTTLFDERAALLAAAEGISR